MKRALILLATLLVATPLALGIMAGLAYYGTSAEHIPSPAVTMLEQAVAPCGYTWRTPVFGGLIYRDFNQPPPQRIADIGEMAGANFDISVPDGYETQATLSRMGSIVWSGRAAELPDYTFLDSGRYRILVECMRPAQAERGYGSIFYQAAFSVTVDPRYESSEDWVTQGDVMAIRIYNLGSTLLPHAESDLGDVYFTYNAAGQMTAYVPVGHNREPGSYVIYAGAGRSNWEIPLRVTDGSFESEAVELEPGQAYPLNASDAPEGYADYQEHMMPLFSQRDATRYWEGVFIEPVLGKITAEYGLLRYVNESDEAMQHAGVDITAEKGAAVMAANNGRVVFAGALESTGNTVVIEHGGGLKSFYYHLDTMAVALDDMVAQGDTIGTLGGTGVCQSPHLHYEVRLGPVSLNPTLLFNGTSRLYRFE